MELYRNQGNYKVSVVEYPSGKFGLVGSIPEYLTVERKNSIGQSFRASMVFTTREKAERAIR